MPKMYFILKSLCQAEQIQSDLCHLGIHPNKVKFVSRDKALLSQLTVNSDTFFGKRDVLHLTIKGGLIGFSLSAAAAIALSNLGMLSIGLFAASLLMLCATLFGTWLGGVMGFNHENYKLAGDHGVLSPSDSVLVLGMRPEQAAIVEKTMQCYQAKLYYPEPSNTLLTNSSLVTHSYVGD